MEFSRQKCCSGSHSLLQVISPTQGLNLGRLQADSLPSEPPGQPLAFQGTLKSLLQHHNSYWYGCETWSIKKAEHQRVDAFQLWCWRSLFRIPWTERRSNQSILEKSTLNIHWKDWCWSSNTLSTWCKDLIHCKRPQCWKRLKAKGEEGAEDEMVR